MNGGDSAMNKCVEDENWSDDRVNTEGWLSSPILFQKQQCSGWFSIIEEINESIASV